VRAGAGNRYVAVQTCWARDVVPDYFYPTSNTVNLAYRLSGQSQWQKVQSIVRTWSSAERGQMTVDGNGT